MHIVIIVIIQIVIIVITIVLIITIIDLSLLSHNSNLMYFILFAFHFVSFSFVLGDDFKRNTIIIGGKKIKLIIWYASDVAMYVAVVVVAKCFTMRYRGLLSSMHVYQY